MDTKQPAKVLTRSDRRRYLVEAPFHPWNSSPSAHSDWTAVRCKSAKNLGALCAALHTSSLFLCPRIKQGTTVFIPTEAWNGFAIPLIESLPLASELNTESVCHKDHLNPSFLSRMGRPGHSRQHAWHKADDRTRSGTPEHAFSSIFLLRSVVEAEMAKADEEFRRSEERRKSK